MMPSPMATALPVRNGVFAADFYGVPRRMAKIEDVSKFAVALVRFDNPRLIGNALRNGLFHLFARGSRLKQAKQRFAGEDSGFNRLGGTVGDFALRQGGKTVRIADHKRRLVEQPREVLAAERSTAALPPTEESTAAKSEVGACTYRMPRR